MPRLYYGPRNLMHCTESIVVSRGTKSGVAPREDATHKGERIPGYLEVLNAATVS